MSRAIEFWQTQAATIESMYLRSDVRSVEGIERQEIIELLPSFENKIVLDLGAGIGRFTREFAKLAAHVIAVDATAQFTDVNRDYSRAFKNITYQTANVMDLDFAEGAFDLIFINWLLMYLDDVEVLTIAMRIKNWLKPGGVLFFRESCAASAKSNPHQGVYYRPLSFYQKMMDPLLTLQSSGSIQAHIDHFANPFQCYWLYALLPNRATPI